MFEGEQRICSMLQGEHYLQIIASFGETSKWDFHLHFYSFEGEYSRYARERVPPMAVILLSHLLESPNSHHDYCLIYLSVPIVITEASLVWTS